jgi:hypothetical protein
MSAPEKVLVTRRRFYQTHPQPRASDFVDRDRDDLYTDKVEGAGQGLFCRHAIEENEFIAIYRGVRHDVKRGEDSPDGPYVFGVQYYYCY